MSVQPLEHAATIGDVLEALSIPWVLGGSLAGSLHGEPRSTNDVDIALRLEPEGVSGLIDAVGDRYYVPAQALRVQLPRLNTASLAADASEVGLDALLRRALEEAKA